MNKFFSRKLIVTTLTVFLASVLAYLGKVSGTEWSAVVTVVSTGYLGANALASKGKTTNGDGEE